MTAKVPIKLPCGDVCQEIDKAGAHDQTGCTIRTAVDVVAEPVRWLWPEHFALGKIAVVAGAGNAGKSLLVAGDFAARVSNGSPWPDGSACPVGDVLIVSGHDSAADTLVPRLIAHGADMKRVHFLEAFAAAGESETARPLSLCDLLERGLRQRTGVKMVVIDPVWAFLDPYAARSRVTLARLQGLAGRSGAAFIVVTDLRESAGAKVAAAGSVPVAVGARALMSAARSVWVVSCDTEDPKRPSTSSGLRPAASSGLRPATSSGLRPAASSGLRRLFMPAKNNLGTAGHGYAWRLADGKVQWEAERVERAGRPGPAPGRRLAAAFIADFLKDGPRMWGVIEFNAKLAGYKPAALERARGTVAEPFKRTEADGRWLWRLIGDERTSSQGDIADLFGGGEIGLAGPSGRGANARRRSQTTAEIEDDEEDDDEDDEDDE